MKSKAVRLVPILALFSLLWPFGISSAQPEQRVALVIGNAAYRTSPLTNPANDAEDMATALNRIGFTVIKRLNVDRPKMMAAVREFGDKIKRGGVGLFFYAGHGLQVDGENYLVPVDADVQRKYDVDVTCLKASYVLGAMEEAGNRLNIIILDACRDNPFRGFRSTNRGLAQMNAPVGSILAYATAPGSVASDGTDRNGLYTAKLLKHLTTTNLSLLELFMNVRKEVKLASQDKQIPWETHSLTESYYLVPTGSMSPTTSASPPATTVTPGTARPTVPTVKLGDIKDEAKARQSWQEWQAAMDKAWLEVETLENDSNLPSAKKAEAWQRVLAGYGDDNPYSAEDDGLRSKARQRLAYWQSQRTTGLAGPSAAAPALDLPGKAPAWLGVVIEDLSPEVSQQLGASQLAGVYIRDVERKGPADKGGIKKDDVILTFNKQKLAAAKDLPPLVAASDPGDIASLEVWRNSKRLTLEVKLEAMAAPEMLRRRGLDKAQNKDFDGAIADYNGALALNEQYTRVFIDRGRAFWRKGNTSQAMTDFNQALAREPINVEALTERAFLRNELGDRLGAEADVRHGLTLDPSNPRLQALRKYFEASAAGSAAKAPQAGSIPASPPPQGCFIGAADFE
ncbi:MAG: caspase family protein [Thermodesulfobacteriota bacterium]